jgi:predicted phosphodiesterase
MGIYTKQSTFTGVMRIPASKYMAAVKTFLFLFPACFLTACSEIEFSPNQKFDRNTPSGINQKNIDRLLNSNTDDTIRFVLSGDSQRANDNVKDFVTTVNGMKNIDLVILAGDISDFGLLQEMEWVHKLYSGLKAPYVGVIGNHDLQAKGKDVFLRMYGDLNFSFTYDSIKFVCHDTNSREYNFNGKAPDLNWLRNEFKPDTKIKGFVGIAHVPPFATDFDQRAGLEYVDILNSANLLASMYAHVNNSGVYYYTNPGEDLSYTQSETLAADNESPPFLVTNALQNREFMVIEIINGKLSKKNISY